MHFPPPPPYWRSSSIHRPLCLSLCGRGVQPTRTFRSPHRVPYRQGGQGFLGRPLTPRVEFTGRYRGWICGTDSAALCQHSMYHPRVRPCLSQASSVADLLRGDQARAASIPTALSQNRNKRLHGPQSGVIAANTTITNNYCVYKLMQ